MPYYCTVPRCTSMAGKAKNVSFHQFPRDEELAKLWNDILKRGKPYTKYSKVCSLHFRPEDYTITSVGKNKGQWRTLRKDAVPSQNLPFETPSDTQQRRRSSGAWMPTGMPPNVVDPQVQQQMAQAIYIQTMLAMQAANSNGPHVPAPIDPTESSNQKQNADSELNTDKLPEQSIHEIQNSNHSVQVQNHFKKTSFKCEECSKCFKDPDVFVLHKRTHKTRSLASQVSLPVTMEGQEKENFNTNGEFSNQDTLRANPILANLLKSGISARVPEMTNNVIDTNNVLSIENQIMTALAANMESYIRNLSSLLSSQVKRARIPEFENNTEQPSPNSDRDNYDDQNCDRDDKNDLRGVNSYVDSDNNSVNVENYLQIYKNFAKDRQFDINRIPNSADDRRPIGNCEKSSQDSECSQDKQNSPQDKLFPQNCQNSTKDRQLATNEIENSADGQFSSNDYQNFLREIPNSPEDTKDALHESHCEEPKCDIQDLNESKDSNNLVIDENV